MAHEPHISSTSAPREATTTNRPAAIALAVCFLVCVVAHTLTPHTPELHSWHHVHYLMFFLPIALGSVWFGLGVGLGVAVLASLIYAPYTFSHASLTNPGALVEGVVEVVLYCVVGASLGFLADRERKERRNAQATARQLEMRTAQLVQAERRLAQSERLSALGRLAATIAHEVRNPLGSIKGSAEILRDDFPAGNEKHRFLSIVVEEADRLNAVLNNFLEFARPPALELHSTALPTILAHVTTLVQPQCKQQRITIEVQGDAEVPAVYADERQLQQALLNLVLNAMEAMPDGGKLTVQCGPAADGHVALAVLDTGPGLDEAQLARALEPFYSTKHDGTGLGLATAQKIVQAHGGTLTLENRTDGGGGVATVTLPIDAPATREVQHA